MELSVMWEIVKSSWRPIFYEITHEVICGEVSKFSYSVSFVMVSSEILLLLFEFSIFSGKYFLQFGIILIGCAVCISYGLDKMDLTLISFMDNFFFKVLSNVELTVWVAFCL